MGTLVFQAALGGQINLTGTNTASTFTITVPAVTGNMITSGDTATVTSAMISGPVTTAKGGTGLTSFTANGVVYASSTSALATGSALVFDGANLGLGVTPSAWVSGRNCVEIGGSVQPSIAFNGSTVANGGGIWTNGFNNGTNNVYKANGTASRLDTGAGGFAFYLAPSGTAGNAITFTQAMTLDASGNLGVGTTSPSTRLHVKAATDAANVLQIQDSSATQTLNFGVNNVNGGPYIFVSTNQALRFGTNDTERARIDSGGNFLVGTTSTGIPNANSNAFIQGNQVNAHISGSASGSSYIIFGYAGSNIGSVTQTGTTAVLYNTTSDQRLKENIQDSAPASALIDAIQVRQYNWKSDGSFQRYGFVAQELVTVAPEAVHQPADPEEMMAVDYSKLVPMLVKEIQSLRKRLTALEGKA